MQTERKLVPIEPDQIHQMAFEEGNPADNGDGYSFSAEEFDLFVERLLSAIAMRPPAPAEDEPADALTSARKQLRTTLAAYVRAGQREHALRAQVAALTAQCAEQEHLLQQLRDIADERTKGYAGRVHGGVLNGQCMDDVCALLQPAPAACLTPANHQCPGDGVGACKKCPNAPAPQGEQS